jgi:hypothetical protein
VPRPKKIRLSNAPVLIFPNDGAILELVIRHDEFAKFLLNCFSNFSNKTKMRDCLDDARNKIEKLANSSTARELLAGSFRAGGSRARSGGRSTAGPAPT